MLNCMKHSSRGRECKASVIARALHAECNAIEVCPKQSFALLYNKNVKFDGYLFGRKISCPHLKFDDGTADEVDLSHLAGKGVFIFWNDDENFRNVSIEKGRSFSWSHEIDLDADTLYLKLTGKKPEELFPALKEESTYA
jgi:hypothetical protein